MVVCFLMGGLGNQLFQFSAAYAYAQKFNTSLGVNVSFFNKDKAHGGYRLSNLLLEQSINYYCNTGYASNLIYRACMKWPNFLKKVCPSVIHESQPQKLIFTPVASENTMLGYWQDEKYFSEHRSFLIKNIVPRCISSQANNISLRMKEVCSVSLHVRRGDYFNNKIALSIHGVCSVRYYKDAILKIKSELQNANFFIFTNDAVWVKEQFGDLFNDLPMMLVEGNSQEEDLWLMSQAKHHIIANSSFSWWGRGWLNMKIKLLLHQRHGMTSHQSIRMIHL